MEVLRQLSISKLILSVLASAAILFIWNAVSWMALPFHSNSLRNIPDEAINFQQLQTSMQQDGVYHYPGFPMENSESELNDLNQKFENGPRISLMVYKNGATQLFQSAQFLRSFLINFISAICFLLIISNLRKVNRKSILLSSIAIGLLTAFVSDFGQMNWHLFPLDYTLVNALDKVISLLLVGLLLSLYTFKNFKYDH